MPVLTAILGFRTFQHKNVGFFLILKWFLDVKALDSPSDLSRIQLRDRYRHRVCSHSSFLGRSFQNSIDLRGFLLTFQTKSIPETLLAKTELFISLKAGKR